MPPLSLPVLAVLSAWAGEPWEDQLRAQTRLRSEAAHADMAGAGYHLVGVARTHVLDAGAEETVSLRLTPGTDYRILGVCDDDCTDLDLSLRNGRASGEAGGGDRWPMLSVRPVAPASTVQVTMAHCATPNCGYQLTVWKR